MNKLKKLILTYIYNILSKDVIEKEVKKEVIVHTISKEAMDKLRSRLPNAMVSASDSDTVAAHKLGVQCALQELERGFVV